MWDLLGFMDLRPLSAPLTKCVPLLFKPSIQKEKNPLILGIGISHLVLIDSRAGAQQEQGEGGALELFTHLPKEVTERSTWKRERGNDDNIPLFPAEFLSAAVLSSTLEQQEYLFHQLPCKQHLALD